MSIDAPRGTNAVEAAAEGGSKEWQLPPFWWATIILPFLAFTAMNWMLTHWGTASLQLALPWVADGHAEAAGRLRTEASFLLYCGLAIATIAYVGIIVRPLSTASRRRLAWAWAAALTAGVTLVLMLDLNRGDPYVENSFACASFELLPAAKARADVLVGARRHLLPPSVVAAKPAPGRYDITRIRCHSATDATPGNPFAIPSEPGSFKDLKIMYAICALLLFLGMPAAVWGAVACLALPRDDLNTWEAQTVRLNRLLYITAGFMVTGLLFTSARLMWPGYSLHPADFKPYAAHVSAMVQFSGVGNTLVIASYYLPCAAWLAKQRPVAEPSPADGASAAARSGSPEGPDPYAAFKTTAAILSPALVALVAEFLKFTG